jgi:hypothetical protein
MAAPFSSGNCSSGLSGLLRPGSSVWIKAGGLRRIQKPAVFQTGQVRETGRLAVVIGEKEPQALINAFVKQEFH